MRKIYLLLFIACYSSPLFAQKQITTATELKKLSEIRELPVYDQGTALRQTSSYDTTGNNDDGFSGKYSFIRKNADSSLVIFEAKGNGVINRIWTPTPTDDLLDFYFGGSKKPSFSIRFADLFSGKVFPFVTPLTGNELGGYFSYLPIPFKNGCKIVLRGKQLQFYQIQYRSYPKKQNVQNFSITPDAETTRLVKQMDDNWNSVADLKEQPLQVQAELKPGESLTLADIKQGGRITGIKLQGAKAFRGLHKQIDLKITWDNEQQPAVYMPLADFFGYAFGEASMQSLLLGTANDVLYSYFPMPFSSSAKIELVYRRPDAGVEARPVNIQSAVYVSNQAYIPSKEGKFYAFWNADKKATTPKPHLLLQGSGKGHYVGTILQAQGLTPGMTLFFEGDDVTRIDGELRIHGTGSEDYFNGGWYALLDRWDRKMSLPLHGSLDYSLPFARTGGYRLFIADKMPFEKEIYHSIEHGPENNNKPGDYTSVAFYYAGNAITTTEKAPENRLTGVYIPDTLMIYPQLMQYSVGGPLKIDGNIFQSSQGAQLKIDMNDIPKGRYKLYADIEKSPDGAEIVVWQRQKQVSESFSFYAEKRQGQRHVFLTPVKLDDFNNAITLHFKKDDVKSVVHIQRLILVRERE